MSVDDSTMLGLGGPTPERPSLPVAPGAVIAGKYRVLQLVAAGDMGAVIAAHHEALNQRVAIKMLLPELMKDPEAAERFMREARATARIRSDYVARVLDVDQLEEGSPYIVMEYLSGRSLERFIEDEGTLEADQAVDLVMEALTGLAHAHGAGVVHRDLKPSNLFVATLPNGRPRVKVLDFGISKLVVSDGLSDPGVSTGQRQILGSPQYMSPEQVSNPRDVDARTDLWSMGVILFELLTGEPVFDAETVGAVLALIVRETPPRLDSIRADVDPDLADVVAKALARDPDERFARAEDMLAALAPHASRRTRQTLMRSSFPPPAREPKPERMAEEELPPIPGVSPVGRRLAVASIALLGVALLVYLVSDDSEAAAKRAATPLLAPKPVPRAPVPTPRTEATARPVLSAPTVSPRPVPVAPVPHAEPNVLEHRSKPLPAPASPPPKTDPLEFRD